MLLFEILGAEDHPAYRAMQAQNNARLHDYMLSAIEAALAVDKLFLSQTIIRAMNFHAITTLHVNAGEYRVCEVAVGDFEPPPYFRVAALMDDFTNTVNRYWESANAINLAAYVLWRLNYIHPFINGNGRAARAAAYFVLCVKSGGLLPGNTTLPELLLRDRNEKLVPALQQIDQSMGGQQFTLLPLIELISDLVIEQLDSQEN